jgi:hypothetical protein
MTAILASLIATFVVSVVIERLLEARSHGLARSPGALAFRLAIYGYAWLFFFAWSWRPWSSAWAVVWLVAAFAAISNAKQRFIHEPLAFSDLAFIADVFRHPKLFYTSLVAPLVLVGLLIAIATSVTICFHLEAHLVPPTWPETVVWAGFLFAILALPFWGPTRHRLAAAALAVKREPDIEHDVARDGTLTTLVLDWLGWIGDDRVARMRAWPSPALHLEGMRRVDGAADLVIAVQGESFIDLRRLGSSTLALPALDAARRRAVAWGPLVNACPGGYTMRSEFAFLVGEPNAALGFDRYYPYLAGEAYRERTLVSRARSAGYATLFVHPYHATFFSRRRTLPLLGFDRLETLPAFADAPRVGDYVSDVAVADRVLAEARAGAGRQFILAATMENHGPWVPGRFPGVTDPVAIFERHLANADAMLGRLIEGLQDWPGRAVLVFYGDHVPLLKAFADPFPDTRTDYVLLELGAAAGRYEQNAARELAIHDLSRHCAALAGWPLPGEGGVGTGERGAPSVRPVTVPPSA